MAAAFDPKRTSGNPPAYSRQNPVMSHSDLESRARALVDEKLIRAYRESVEHYKTSDLVLIYVAGDARYPVRAFAREELLSSTLPADIKAKIADPASDAASPPASSDATFWLIAIFSDEEAACLAVNAKRMAPVRRS